MVWGFATIFSHSRSLSHRYGTKVEDFLEVHLRTPGLLQEDVTEEHRLGARVDNSGEVDGRCSAGCKANRRTMDFQEARS